jgi:hypothetical protein
MRSRHLRAYCVALLLCAHGGRSWTLILKGDVPEPLTNTLWAAIGTPLLVLFLIWTTVVLLYRRKYLDVGHSPRDPGGDRFLTFWSSFTGNLKRLSLFLLTISYMPVARAILENFSGEYDPEILETSGYCTCM